MPTKESKRPTSHDLDSVADAIGDAVPTESEVGDGVSGRRCINAWALAVRLVRAEARRMAREERATR